MHRGSDASGGLDQLGARHLPDHAPEACRVQKIDCRDRSDRAKRDIVDLHHAAQPHPDQNRELGLRVEPVDIGLTDLQAAMQNLVAGQTAGKVLVCPAGDAPKAKG